MTRTTTKTRVATAAAETIDASPRAQSKTERIEDAKQRVFAAHDALLKELGVGSTTRRMVAFVTALVGAAVVGYPLLTATTWLSAAAMLFTGSTFLSFITVFVGTALAFVSSLRAFNVVHDYMTSDAPERHITKVRNWWSDRMAMVRARYAQ